MERVVDVLGVDIWEGMKGGMKGRGGYYGKGVVE